MTTHDLWTLPQVNYFLIHDETKRSHLLTLLRLYAKDRNVYTLGTSLNILLETPIERRLLPDIRCPLAPISLSL